MKQASSGHTYDNTINSGDAVCRWQNCQLLTHVGILKFDTSYEATGAGLKINSSA